MYNALTDVPGITVGHWTNLAAATGCTVILCPEGAVAGVDVRGGAPGTRETDLLNPACMVEKVHAICLAGGSAYGLAAADGVMRWLEAHGYGFDVRIARVPIVPTAVIFDLALGRADVRPDAAAGYVACEAASAGPIAEGNVGAGTGATVGKILGYHYGMKGGLGTASLHINNGVVIAALAVVNAAGDIVDPKINQIVAGARRADGAGIADIMATLAGGVGPSRESWGARNTTLGVVATNVALTKAGANKLAQVAQTGLTRAIRPVHTLIDGDVVFALSLGDKSGDPTVIGALAADVLSEAIVRAVRAAETLHGMPAAKELLQAQQ
ncbi:MAG: peptidase S58 family protein [Caldilinea sp. CFX5]|nr:peptidase S58 family protein [Caldilinea sp. CFX5]